MKRCTSCNEVKEYSCFNTDGRLIDGKQSHCKICQAYRKSEWRKTPNGLISRMYDSQLTSSKIRGHNPPKYTLSEFLVWIKSQSNFVTLYDEWVKSGYDKWMKPSCDRLNDYEGYSFNNMKLTTWELNRLRSHEDIKNGVNNKLSKAVNQLTMNGIFIKRHYSIASAEREVGAHNSHITKCCKGKVNSSRGFKWEYANN